MVKNVTIALLLLLLAASLAWHSFRSPPEPWRPVLEDTSFQYLDDVAKRTEEAVQSALEYLQSDRAEQIGHSLQKAAHDLEELRHYYLPMTEVRQLIYDADRLFYLNEPKEAYEKLKDARRLLRGIGPSEHPQLHKLAEELILMVEDTVLAVEERSPEAASKFKELGHRVNLLALKGEMILSE